MDMRKELDRLASFKPWTQDSGISILTLARVGFYYNGRRDEVECFQCKTRISGWKEGDNVEEKHRLMAPQCPMVNGNCPDNVTSDRNMPALGQVAVAVSGQTVVDGANNFDETPQPHEEPTDMESIYKQALSRAKKNGVIFHNNGPAVDLLQLDFDERQSEATGISIGADRVESFQNGIVGQGQTTPRSGAPAASPSIENDLNYVVLYEFNQKEVEARMDTPIVCLVLAMGFPRSDVEAVIKRRLSTTGDDFPDGASLLQALFELQDKAAAPGIVNTSSGENSMTEEVTEGTGQEDIVYKRDNT